MWDFDVLQAYLYIHDYSVSQLPESTRHLSGGSDKWLYAEGHTLSPPKLDKRSWNVICPHSVVAQTSEGTIYFTEPGSTSFCVLQAQ